MWAERRNAMGISCSRQKESSWKAVKFCELFLIKGYVSKGCELDMLGIRLEPQEPSRFHNNGAIKW